jgi:hypothetical protein
MASPAPWRTLAGCGVDRATLGKDGDVTALVPVARRYETHSGMQVLVVVPVLEAGYPFAGLLERREGLARIVGAVLQGPKQRLAIGVIVADTRSAEGGNDS